MGSCVRWLVVRHGEKQAAVFIPVSQARVLNACMNQTQWLMAQVDAGNRGLSEVLATDEAI